jgi:hypothetical protein
MLLRITITIVIIINNIIIIIYGTGA